MLTGDRGERSQRRRVALWMGGAAGLALLFGLFWWGHRAGPAARGPSTGGEQRERSCAQQLAFEDFQLSRAENFLQQEVTYVSGSVTNHSDCVIQNIALRLVFRDAAGRPVREEVRWALGVNPLPLHPQERRAFQIGFEGLPESWNLEMPEISVVRLVLH